MRGLWIYSISFTHLLVILLRLEYMVLRVIYVLIITRVGFSFFGMLFLIFSVCEGALGLSLLVRMSRSHGGDYLSFLRLI
jgi:NADH-ubiquinone oxidoreductase chain 4L